jgi:hypothetical protein
VEKETPRGMASSLHKHAIGHTMELVYRPGIAQRNCDLGDVAKKNSITFSFEYENPNIDTTLKWIRGVILIKEPKVELITEEQRRNKQTVKDLLSCYHV